MNKMNQNQTEKFWEKVGKITTEVFQEEDHENLMFDVLEELASNLNQKAVWLKIQEMATEVLETYEDN